MVFLRNYQDARKNKAACNLRSERRADFLTGTDSSAPVGARCRKSEGEFGPVSLFAPGRDRAVHALHDFFHKHQPHPPAVRISFFCVPGAEMGGVRVWIVN